MDGDTLLGKARVVFSHFPETPTGWKLRKQLQKTEVVAQLEEMLKEEEEEEADYQSHRRAVAQEFPLVTDLDYAHMLIEEKIKPSLQEILQPATTAKEPRIFLQRGDGSIRDHLIATASPTQYAVNVGTALMVLATTKSPLRALKSLGYDLAVHEAMARIRPFLAQYDKLMNAISCKALPEDIFLFAMTHEYVHYYQNHHSFDTPRISYSKVLSEGHAEASADAALRLLESQGKLHGEEHFRRMNAVDHIRTTFFHLCPQAYGSDGVVAPTIYDTGYTLFRLAEEKNGTDVYAKMLIGDVAALRI